MKIVQLESHVSNFDNLADKSFWEDLGEYVSYERVIPGKLLEQVGDAEAVLSNKTVFGEKEFNALPNLKYIGILATGYNVIDLDAAKRHGVTVTNVPAYSTESVAQLVFAHILNLTRAVEKHAENNWSTMQDFSVCLTPQMEINEKTLGIIGFGAIGHAVARIANAFGMNVIAFTRTMSKIDLPFVKPASLDEVLSQSDFLSLHCPMTKETQKLINRENIAKMKNGAFLINTSRGGLVDEQALADALNSGKLAGAGLDVLTQEPPSPDNPLLHCPTCRITSHIAWTTKEARTRLLNCARENLRAWLAGKPQNTVS